MWLSSVEICIVSITCIFLFVDLSLFTWEWISRTRWVQRQSAVHWRHQQARCLNPDQSNSLQWQWNLLLWRKEPARYKRNTSKNRAQSCAERLGRYTHFTSWYDTIETTGSTGLMWYNILKKKKKYNDKNSHIFDLVNNAYAFWMFSSLRAF